MPALSSGSGAVEELEIAAVFWAGRDPGATLAELTRLGVRRGQLVIPGDLDLPRAGGPWPDALHEAGFSVYTVFAAYSGESYADIPTVKRTVGFIPPATRAEREKRTFEVSDFAARIGARGIATHIGFVPEDDGDPDYIAVREMVRRICDYASKQGQTFALETGQEQAQVLLDFIHDVNRDNLGINFDPANLILYGTGDPIEALGVLFGHLLSVHCKDGDWPPKNQPGALGTEQPLGKGAVGMDRFLRELKRLGYKGPIAIERETEDPDQRMRDIEAGIELLRNLKKKL